MLYHYGTTSLVFSVVVLSFHHHRTVSHFRTFFYNHFPLYNIDILTHLQMDKTNAISHEKLLKLLQDGDFMRLCTAINHGAQGANTADGKLHHRNLIVAVSEQLLKLSDLVASSEGTLEANEHI